MKFAKTLQLAALALVVATTTTAAREHPDSAPALNDKGALLRVFSQVANKHDAYIKQDVVVCSDTQETCYDKYYNPVSCGDIAEGGCTCPEELTKCNGPFCTAVCCDSDTQETCYDDDYNSVSCGDFTEGGCTCPEGLTKCNGPACTAVCCDSDTEETCYDENWKPESCAPFKEGGCPCPEGQVKCGVDEENSYGGYCTELCCDTDTEETCYDENWEPESCAPIAEGGCPCPEGEARCDIDEENGNLGWCNNVCCDSDKGEYYCFSGHEEKYYCCATNEFPSNARSYDMQKIQTKGTRREISYFHNLNMQQKKLLADGKSNVNSAKLALKQKKAELFYTIKLREGNPSSKNGASL